MDEAWVRQVLLDYEAIVDRAQVVAQIVYRIRFPRDYDQAFDIEFSEDERTVIATYFYRQNNHQVTFPRYYLSSTDDDVRELEAQRLAAEQEAAKQRRALQEAAEEAEREQIERKTYERLKAKYEGEGDGRTRKRTTAANRSSDAA